MTDVSDKDVFNVLKRAISDKQRRKITDYDMGLLQDIFEPITGTPEEKFDRWSDRLIRINARLENLHKDTVEENKPQIIDRIYEFFDELKLPSIIPMVIDTAVDQKYGRMVKIVRTDNENQSESYKVSDIQLMDATQIIRQEQYLILTAKVKRLFAEAISELKKTEFQWHKTKNFSLNIPSIGKVNISGSTAE